MQIYDARLVDGAVQLVDVVCKPHAMLGNHIRSSARRCGGIVAVLGHFVSRTGNHKACRSRDVKRVLAVATCSNHIDIAVAIENGRHSCLQNTIAEPQQFVNRDTSHLQGGQQGGNLFVGYFTLRDTHQNVASLLTGENLVIEHAI